MADIHRRCVGLPFFVVALGSSAVVLAGEDPVEAAGARVEAEPVESVWFLIRDDLAREGVTVGLESTSEFSAVLDGGIRRESSQRNLLTADLEFDLEKIADVEGARLFLQYLGVNRERGGPADAGDLQVYSNIESDRSLDVIYELWYEQLFLDGRLRLKAGKVDANSEFAFVDAAGEFANSSAGFSPTVHVLPSYPDPATSVNLFATLVAGPRAQLILGYGLYDGAAGVDGVPTGTRGPSSFLSDDLSGDYFHIVQAELVWDSVPEEGGSGRVSAGAWYHTGEFARFDGGVEGGAAGFFVTAEVRCFTPEAGLCAARSDSDGGGRGLFAFGQFGWADGAVTEVSQHFGLGLVWRGVFDDRAEDSMGIYASLADLSSEPMAGFARDELALDAYFRFQATPWMFVQPEVQYVVHPSGRTDIGHALVGGLRVGIRF